jgi:hypothetical protein
MLLLYYVYATIEVNTIKRLLSRQDNTEACFNSNCIICAMRVVLTVVFRISFACPRLQQACVFAIGCSIAQSVKIIHYRGDPEELCVVLCYIIKQPPQLVE